MAEENKTPAKVQESWLTKVLNWFKLLPGRIATPFKNMVAELRKVTWPSKKRLISSSIMVLVFMLFMGVVIGLLDLGATTLVRGMVGLGNDTVVEETADTTLTDETAEAETEADGNVEEAEAPAEATETPAE